MCIRDRGKTLDVVLKKYGLLDNPKVKAVVLGVIPMDQKQIQEYLSGPEGWTAYPVDIPSDHSVMELFDSLKLNSFPAAAVVRDGTLPVSYTHLDVYKRQMQPHPSRSYSRPTIPQE